MCIYLHSWLAVPLLETKRKNKNGSGTGGSSLRNQVAEPEILFPLPFRDSLLICLWGGFKGTGVDRMCTSVRVPLKDLFGKSFHHRRNWRTRFLSKSWRDWSFYRLWNLYLVGNSNKILLIPYLSHKCKKKVFNWWVQLCPLKSKVKSEHWFGDLPLPPQFMTNYIGIFVFLLPLDLPFIWREQIFTDTVSHAVVLCF